MAKRVQRDREQFGDLALHLTAADRLALVEAKRKAKERGVTLWEIFDAGLGVLVGKPESVHDLAEQFVAVKDAAMKAGELRRTTRNTTTCCARRFASVFGTRLAPSITQGDVAAYLSGTLIAGKANKPSRSHTAVFINWCIARRQMQPGILKGAHKRKAVEDLPVIYDHARVLEIVKLLPADLIHVFALQWFAGIRPHTTYRLRYEDILHDQKLIEIPPGSGKSQRREFVEHIPDTVWSWIPRGLKGWIAPKNAPVRMTEARRLWGFGTAESESPHDVARHTFATHMLALTKDLALTSQALTHTTIQMTKRYYLNRVSHEAGVAYFAMTPEAVFGSDWRASVPQTPTLPEKSGRQ